MSKILRVIEPFFTAEFGDSFVLSEDGKNYVQERDEVFHTTRDNDDMISSYKSSFTISTKWAEQLIEDGYLEEQKDDKADDKPFVNVFDEIDSLLKKYQNDLDNVDKDLKDMPDCLRVERVTVLTNLIKVLGHLKSLRK